MKWWQLTAEGKEGIPMATKEVDFTLYLKDIAPEYAADVTALHDLLMQSGFKLKMQESKNGQVVSYADPKTKRVAANFVTRKAGPFIRIYGDHAGKYQDFLQALPGELSAAIAKSSSCKRLLNPADCNAKCAMGYTVTLNGETHKKCRYGCFFFPVSSGTAPYIKAFLENEIRERLA
jgi:hypothetical protein